MPTRRLCCRSQNYPSKSPAVTTICRLEKIFSTAATFTQQYDYDSLNRVQRVHDGTTWQQEHTYDRYGNRIINTAGNKTWGTGINNLSESIHTTTNSAAATKKCGLANKKPL